MPLKAFSSPPLWGRLLWLAAGPLTALPALLGTAPAATGTVTATATAAVTLALFAALALAWRARADASYSRDPRPARVAVRARIQRTAFLPQRDPDASGRPRPRAPGRCRTHP